MAIYSNEEPLTFSDDIYELYRSIKSGNDLAKWISFRLQSGHKELEWQINEFSDTFIDGMIDSHLFRVEIYDKSRVFLKIEDSEESEELLEVLKKIIAPTIWHLGTKNKGKNVYRAEILQYSIGSQVGSNYQLDNEIELYKNFGSTEDPVIPIKVVVWDVEKPKELIKDILQQHLEGYIRINTIESFYPGIDLEVMMEDLYYGYYSGCIDDAYARHVQTCSEFELFYTIKSVREEIINYSKIFKTDSVPDELEIRIMKNYTYVYEFLVEQTRRFDIRTGIPNSKLCGKTVEFAAWYAWWEEGFNQLITENPNIFEEWKNLKSGFDPNFRPKASFESFLVDFRNKLLEAENARKLKQQEFLNGKIKTSPDERKQLREIRNARSKTVLGRIRNLLDNVKENTAKQISENEKNAQSPYDYI